MKTATARAVRQDRAVQRAAHPIFEPLLRAIPGDIVRLPGVGVLVRDVELAREAMLRRESFFKSGPGTSSDMWTPVVGENVLLNMSGPDHAELRRKLGPLFTPKAVEALVDQSLGEPLEQAVHTLQAGGRVDMVQLANRCSSRTIGTLIGVPSEHVGQNFYRDMQEISGSLRIGTLRLTGARLLQAQRMMAEVSAIAEASWLDGDEATIPGRMRALGLTKREALGAVGAFLLAGTETITSFLPRVVAIAIDSGWMQRLQTEPEYLDPLIAEGLRITTPVPVALRHVPEPSRLGRMRLRKGDRLIILLLSAVQEVQEFDPANPVPASFKQLWFGAGAHYCLGAPLAVAQSRRMVRAVLEGCAGGTPTITSRAIAKHRLIAGYRSLEVRA